MYIENPYMCIYAFTLIFPLDSPLLVSRLGYLLYLVVVAIRREVLAAI